MIPVKIKRKKLMGRTNRRDVTTAGFKIEKAVKEGTDGFETRWGSPIPIR